MSPVKLSSAAGARYPGIQKTSQSSRSGNKTGQCARCRSIDKLRAV